MRPNIILIVCDQLRPFEIGFYGGDKSNTPNMDNLAKDSCVFETAVSPNPVCTPARSCVLSGQYSRTCMGTLFNAAEPTHERIVCKDKTLPEHLKEIGYETTIFGKWHIHSSPETLGFDRAVIRKYNHLNENQTFYANGNKYVVDGNAAEYELALAKDYFNEEKENPFFLFYNISLPHMPYFDVEEKFLKKYDSESVKLRENAVLGDNLEFNETWFKIYLHDYLFYSNPEDERYNKLPHGFDLKTLYAMYKGAISAADYQLGKLLEMMDDANLRENTIIIFTADHGDNMGSHGLFNKDVSYDESIRIPMFYSYKGHIKPSVNKKDIVSLIDIAPTVLDFAGIDIPKYMQGTSLKPSILNESYSSQDYSFIECTNGEIAVRTKTHLFSILTKWNKEDESIREIVDSEYRFFNTEKDPFQTNSLAKGNEERGIAEKLKSLVLNFNKDTNWVKFKE